VVIKVDLVVQVILVEVIVVSVVKMRIVHREKNVTVVFVVLLGVIVIAQKIHAVIGVMVVVNLEDVYLLEQYMKITSALVKKISCNMYKLKDLASRYYNRGRRHLLLLVIS